MANMVKPVLVVTSVTLIGYGLYKLSQKAEAEDIFDYVTDIDLEHTGPINLYPGDVVMPFFSWTNPTEFSQGYRFRLTTKQGGFSHPGPLSLVVNVPGGESEKITLLSYIPWEAVPGEYVDAEITGTVGILPEKLVGRKKDFWLVQEVLPKEVTWMDCEYTLMPVGTLHSLRQGSIIDVIPYVGPGVDPTDFMVLSAIWRNDDIEDVSGWCYLLITYPDGQRVFEPTPMYLTFAPGVVTGINFLLDKFVPDTAGTYSFECWIAKDHHLEIARENFTFRAV